jgi:hypothetical protein
MSVYRTETPKSLRATSVLAATGDQRRALTIAGVIVLVPVVATVVLLASLPEMAWVYGGMLLATAGLLAVLFFFQFRPAFTWITADTLSVQDTWRTRTFSVRDLRSAEGEYRAPGAAMAAAMIIVAKTRAIPKPILTLHLDTGPEDVVTANYRQSPDLIARRLRRYLRKGAVALAPSDTEVARQTKRHAEPTLFRGSLGATMRGARFLESGPQGLRVGNSQEKMVLHPWREIVAAHVTRDLHGGEIGEVELADGRVIVLRGSYDLPFEELVLEIAPRAYGLDGERLRRAKSS